MSITLQSSAKKNPASGRQRVLVNRVQDKTIFLLLSSVFNVRVLSVSIALAMNISPAYSASPLPVRVPGAGFVHAGDAAYLVDGFNATINQYSPRVILNWQSFDVDAGYTVNFNQPSTSSVALNRIFQNDPSKILGSINANGQIYLYNQNGFIFGKGMRFNANNIVATTLDVDDALFLNSSILSAIETGQPAFFDTTGNNTGVINIENGAEITANTILMIAPEIVNAGVLNSADGQTILAASKDKVYLAASDKDPGLRGLLVEVGIGGTVTNAAETKDSNGNVKQQAGSINAERGNVTLIGYAVNQNGRIRATTSSNKNGSIRLLARDSAVIKDNTTYSDEVKDIIGADEQPTASFLAQAQRSGQVIVGKNSVMEIAVDSDTITKVPDAQNQLKSKVEIVGKQIWLQENSTIVAPSGNVKITATANPGSAIASARNDSYVYMDAGSVIDVSGTDTAILAMERNSLAVEVRSNELADSSKQRGGVLQGKTVYIDLRKGTELVDYSGAVANIEKTVAERLSTGGNISIRSQGDFVQRDGAVLDISGGKVRYEDGFIKETKLISQGQIFNISDADNLRQYDAILGDNTKFHDRWAVTEAFSSSIGISNGRFVTGFEEGKAAGSIDISAASAILAPQGIKADVTIGQYQTSTDLLPKSGALDLNLRQFTDSTQGVTFLAESLVDAMTDAITQPSQETDLLRDNISGDLLLPDTYLQDSGLGTLTISSNGDVVVAQSATVEARPGTEINLTGHGVIVDGNIIDHTGTVNLNAELITGSSSTDKANILIADGALIDVSGNWINNTEFVAGNSLNSPDTIHGGAINLRADGDITVEGGALLNASGGALLDNKLNLRGGKGGDIAIAIAAYNIDGLVLDLKGTMESYSLTSGGTLSLEAASVLITDKAGNAATPDQLLLGKQDFESGGFSRYEITANAGDFVVDIAMSPLMQNLLFNDGSAVNSGLGKNTPSVLPLIASGTSIKEITHVATRPDFERQPVSLAFTLAQVKTDKNYNFSVSENSLIKLDPGAKLLLSSDTRLFFGGKIDAPAAEVSLQLTSPDSETGYLDNQAIWLAAGSEIDVSSTLLYRENDQGLLLGQAFDAGRVNLTANRGYVVIEDGARVDVSAHAKSIDVLVKKTKDGPVYQRTAIAPDAGEINIVAAEGVVIDGDLIANAAELEGARGGSFSLELAIGIRGITYDINNVLAGGQQKFDFDSRDIVVAENIARQLDASVQFGDVIDDSLHAIASVDAGKLETAGFDSVALITDHVFTDKTAAASEIRFASEVNLSLKNSLLLNAPTINTADNAVQLDAAYVALGTTSKSRNSVATTQVVGDETLDINAALIDIIGDIKFTRTALVKLTASDDLRFIGANTTQAFEQLTGGITAATDINLTAGQIYPASNSKISIDLINKADGVVTIAGNGNQTPVLSALGELVINAPIINQGGVIKAPLGRIELNAQDKVSLLAGSVTSISAEGQIIPFGKTINAGGDWTYKIKIDDKIQLVDKAVEINAPIIDLQENSLVDISGSGDAIAYEFVAGPTGSKDLLLTENASGAFAILPDSASQYAPYDKNESNALSNVGQQVYLEGSRDLAAGYYTILPARYALLPGAKLVTPFAGTKSILPNESFTRVDGAPVLAGKYATANTDLRDSSYSAFVVEDGSVVRTRSEYIETSANAFFNANRPVDAGALVLSTENSLALDGSIHGEHGAGSRGSRVDIIADNIEVLADGSGVSTSGFIQLSDSALNSLGVDSLMLGGRRRIGDEQTTVEVQSDRVVISNNVKLALPEILLVAKNKIETQSGSLLNGTGGSSDSISESSRINYQLDNNAAIVGVSVNALPSIRRTGIDPGADILLAFDSVLAADKSIFVNSAEDVTLDASFILNGGNLSLGARNISLGNAPMATSGLNLSSELIASLQVDQLEIISLESIDIFEDINLAFNNLVVDAPGINGKSAAGVAVQLTATGDVELKQNGLLAQTDAIGTGTLQIDAQNIILTGDDNAFLLGGFGATKLTARNSLIAAGYGVPTDKAVNNFYDFVNADVVVDTPLVTGLAGASLTLDTTASVALVNSSGSMVDAQKITNLGADFTVNASKVSLDTHVVFPSGFVAFNASGANSSDHVQINNNALIDVSGRTINYVDGHQAGSSAGVISLSSLSGEVITQQNSRLNLSASAVAGEGGRLLINASHGTASLDGQISASHADGFEGASVRVDLDHVADLAAFVQQFQTAGFTRSQNYRLRNGDIAIAALDNGDANVTAKEIIFTADNGAVSIAGRLDASAQKAGRIAIYAKDNIDISAAILDAFSTLDVQGGNITIASTNGEISVDSATQINVAGVNADGSVNNRGKLTLRAARSDANSDVAISDFSANVIGAERIDIEAVAVYNDAVIGSQEQTVYQNDAASWLANKAAIASRLALTGDDRVHYLAGVEVVNAGDITIADAIDFYQWQQASSDVIDEGTFTFRAGNNLNINKSISDAVNAEILYSTTFGGFTFDGPVVSSIKDGESWNYRFVSGADIASANVGAVIHDSDASTGNMTLAANTLIRTGKGDIDITSGGNLELADQTSVIYTVGQGNGSGYFTPEFIDFTLLPDGPQFPGQGGNIRIDVAENINAALSDQYFTDWLQRVGGQISSNGSGDVIPGMWGVVLSDFEQGIATLGGGDINVVAGGDISNLSLSTPTTGQITQLDPDEVVIRGGGDINVAAGGDILSVRLLADGGEATIRAGGDVVADDNGMNTLLALGDASIDIEAGGDIAIEGIGNVTLLPFSTLQQSDFISLAENKNTAYFSTYTKGSAVNLLSYQGDIILNNDIEAIKRPLSNRKSDDSLFAWSVYPGEFAATTLTGDIAINNSFTLFPDADGQLALYSAANIVSREQDTSRSLVDINVSDVEIALLPSITNPVNGTADMDLRLRSAGATDETKLHDLNRTLHLDDAEPLHVVANNNIIGNGELKIRSPKQVEVIAGGDIVDLGIKIQNILATDKSIVMAGGDIRYSLPDTGSVINSEGISITGPGSLTVLSGGDIDLGVSKGIRSLGNLENQTLPEQGADIAVFAGVKNNGLNAELDTSAFIATYFVGESSADSALIDIDVTQYQQQLLDFVLSDTFNGDLTQAVSAVTAQTYANNAEAKTALAKLDNSAQIMIALKSFSASELSEQRKLIIDVFVAELNTAAELQAATKNDSEYARGFLAINRLFAAPISNEALSTALNTLVKPSGGDISLPFSRILSTAGGDINLFAPHGELQVGFTAEVINPTVGSGVLGVVISGKGDLSAMTESNISVNLSRVQALDGGNISLWSSSGDIDAGRGAKTALTIPDALTVIGDNGQLKTIFPPPVSGSGISAGVFSDGLKAGKVTLAAPGGVVDASDGGIASAGDLVVAATKVLGGDNFSAGGATVGVPVAVNVTAGLSGLSSATDNAVNSASSSVASAAADAAANDAGVALVTVEFLGTGNDL